MWAIPGSTTLELRMSDGANFAVEKFSFKKEATGIGAPPGGLAKLGSKTTYDLTCTKTIIGRTCKLKVNGAEAKPKSVTVAVTGSIYDADGGMFG